MNGRKWFSSGAHGAAFGVVLARTSGKPGGGGAMFLVDMQAPGLQGARRQSRRRVLLRSPRVAVHQRGGVTTWCSARSAPAAAHAVGRRAALGSRQHAGRRRGRAVRGPPDGTYGAVPAAKQL
ncbi:hypothetical protein [Nocardia sp. CA-120079]|uniref:hypothetical protein n=1 Tax=Nocardia sp. CA-120079 TaxID=3239974 RepID=UPI003D95D790